MYKLVFPDHNAYSHYLDLAIERPLVLSAGHSVPELDGAPLITYEYGDVPYDLVFGRSGWNVLQGPEWSRKPGATATAFWQNGGMNTLSEKKLWPHGYVNDGLRSCADAAFTSPLAAQAPEIIAFGVGALLFRTPIVRGFMHLDPDTPIRQIGSLHKRTVGISLAQASAPRCDGDACEWGNTSVALDSTNLVMPEVYGELSQIHERRTDEAFIEAYYHYLSALYRRVVFVDNLSGGTTTMPQVNARHLLPGWQDAYNYHLTTGMWADIPGSKKEMVERVARLLDTIFIDTKPIEVVQTPSESLID